LESTLLASGLGFPEGPAVMGDGRLVLCDGNTGELLAYADGKVSTYARTGGSPWGTVLGTDGAIYVTQGGNVPGSGDTSTVSGIQRVMPDGTVELLFSEVDGYELYGPNDLAFGPDGRLYFTESGSEQDFRFDVRSPGRASTRTGSPSTSASGSTGPSRWRTGSAGSATAGSRRRSASSPTGMCPTAWPSPPTAGCSPPRRSPAGSR
jgi:sugar lactone lactonase YvrE